MLHTPSSTFPCTTLSTIFVNHHLSHTYFNHLCPTTIFHIHICQPSLSTTIFHIHISTLFNFTIHNFVNHLCQPPSFTYIFQPSLSSTIFHIHVNHHLSHTSLSSHLWHTSLSNHLCQPSLSTIFVNHHLSHTYFSNHLWRRFASQAWHSETLTFVLRGRRGTYGAGWRAWTILGRG